MSMDNSTAASQLQSRLGLASAPIALAFVSAAPAGAKAFSGKVPSACTFWRLAEREVFYASAEDHFNCPIGVMTMGFVMPKEKMDELMGLVGEMCRIGYLGETEPSGIPSVTRPKSGIVYGPLAAFPVEPDLVLCWLTPYQAMLLSEAAGTSDWAGVRGALATGRPACAALPLALNENRATMSFGCIGMRTFTDVSQGMMLAALPPEAMRRLGESLPIVLEANDKMEEFYQGRKALFA
jgi:uncharacterized protein (DUF169 family)